MTDPGTVISRFRSPAWITTRAVMTFAMLPMGRSVSRPALQRTWPVAALARAASVTWMPAGPPAAAGAACLAETDSPAGAARVPAGAPGIEAAPATEPAWPAG